MINQQNEQYKSLRARANEEGDRMAKCFQDSHEAYARGDGAAAKSLSNEGKAHKQNMENLNKQAGEWIYIGMSTQLRQDSPVQFFSYDHAL